MSLADLYRAAIHDDRRAVVPHRGHCTTRHVFVTSWQSYVTIIVLGLEKKTKESRERSPEAQAFFSHRRTTVTCIAETMSQSEIENRVYCTCRLDGIRNQVTGRKPDSQSRVMLGFV